MTHTGALFNPKTSIVIQKRHPYTGNLNTESSGDSEKSVSELWRFLGVDVVDLQALVSWDLHETHSRC